MTTPLLLALFAPAEAADHGPVRDVVVTHEEELRACGDPGRDLVIVVRYPEGDEGTPVAELKGVLETAAAQEAVSCMQVVLDGARWPAGLVGAAYLQVSAGSAPLAERVVVLGSLPRAAIDAVIQDRMRQIRYCYQRTLVPGKGEPEQPQGKIVVRFTIGVEGAVTRHEMATQEWTVPPADPEAFAGCVLGRFEKMVFPRPDGPGPVLVSYPFVFSPG